MCHSFRRASRLLAAVSALLGLQACEGAGTVVIGVASSGSFVDAARLAFEEAHAGGRAAGIDTLMIAEATNRSAPAIDAAGRFARVRGLVAVVGHSNSSASLATAPIYNERGIVQIAPTSSAVIFSDAGEFSFRLVPADDQQGSFIAAEVERLVPGGGGIAILYVNDDYGRGLRDAVAGRLRTSWPVVFEQPHVEDDLDEADVGHAVAALRDADPALVLWLARGSVLTTYLPPMREALPDVPLLGGDAVDAGGFVNDSGLFFRDVYYVGYADLETTPEGRAFDGRFRARFGRAATTPDALHYDAMNLLLAGIGTGARSGPALRDWLAELGRSEPAFVGVTGPIAFDPRGDVTRGYVLKRMRPPEARP